MDTEESKRLIEAMGSIIRSALLGTDRNVLDDVLNHLNNKVSNEEYLMRELDKIEKKQN